MKGRYFVPRHSASGEVMDNQT